MNRTDPTFRNATISEEEANDFLNDLFSNLFDSDDITSEQDKIPNLSNSD